MKRTIVKSLNGKGQKCKSYFYDSGDILVIHKYTLITDYNSYESFVGGEVLVKCTGNYAISFHRFGIKKETLLKAIIQLENG